MSNFQEIAEELSFRIKGAPNLKDNNHLSELVGILRENEWTEDAIGEFLKNLTEKREKGQTWTTKTGHAGWKPSEDSARYGMKSAEIAQAYVAGKISDDELDKQEKDDKSEEEPKESSKSSENSVTEIPDTTDEQNEKEAAKGARMAEMTDLISREASIEYEAGSSALSKEDARKYSDYLETINTPEGFQAWKDKEKKRRKDLEKKYGPVDNKTIDELNDNLKKDPPEGLGKEGYTSLRNSLMKKGGPPANATKGKYPDDHPDYPGMHKGEVRFRNVLKSYLETGGVCAITGEKVPIQDMQLDHIVSLDNGGKDEPGNWMFTKANINQFKGAKENPAIQADLEEVLNMTDEEWKSKEAENKFKNYKKKEQKAFWKKSFEGDNPIVPTEEQLNKMSTAEVDAFLYGYNESVSEDEQISRYPSQKIKIPGQDEPLSYTRGGVVRPVKDDPDTWGWEVDPDTNKPVRNPETKDSYEDSFKKFDSSRGSGGRKRSKKESIEVILEKKLGTKKASDDKTNDEVERVLQEHREGIEGSEEKKKEKQSKSDLAKSDKFKKGDTQAQIKKQVTKQMKDWTSKNPPPTTYKVKTGEDESGNPIYKDEKIPTKNGKVTKKGKNTRAYKEWEERRDKKEYSLYRQEFYDRAYKKEMKEWISEIRN